MIIIDNKPKFKKYNLVKVDSVLTFNYDGEEVKYRDDHFIGLIKDISKTYHWELENEEDERTDENRVNHHSYSIIDIKTGGKHAWFDEKDLELIEVDGTRFLIQAEENKRKLDEQSTDLSYILSNLETGLNATSILYLFDLIGYRCTGFLNHGEYYSLGLAWDDLGPLFVHIKNADSFLNCFATEDDCAKFIPLCIQYNIGPDDVEKVFNKFHCIGD